MSKVYHKIVTKNTKKSYADIKFLIAYSVYKKQKTEFVENYEKEYGKKPKVDKLKEFQNSCLTETSIENLYAKTEEILTIYGDVVFKNKLKQLNKVDSIVNGKKHFWGGRSKTKYCWLIYFCFFNISHRTYD